MSTEVIDTIPRAGGAAEPALAVNNLSVELRSHAGRITPVNGVSFTIHRGETVGLVGESGSGKSVSMMALMGLLPRHIATVSSGTAFLGNQDLLSLGPKDLNRLRGGRLSMVFQDPMSALNPLMTVGAQLREAIRAHNPKLGRRSRQEKAVKLLSNVGIAQAVKRQAAYPHEFSGGMRQRVMIAMAVANEPEVLVADEPTTALDVTVQARILDLFSELQDEYSTSIIFITHDLGVVAEMADRVIVMYGGRKVEEASVSTLFDDPRHPYSKSLLRSRPRLRGPIERMPAIPGSPPNLQNLPTGCAFHPRCPVAQGRDHCVEVVPPLEAVGLGQESACHFFEEVSDESLWRHSGE